MSENNFGNLFTQLNRMYMVEHYFCKTNLSAEQHGGPVWSLFLKPPPTLQKHAYEVNWKLSIDYRCECGVNGCLSAMRPRSEQATCPWCHPAFDCVTAGTGSS